MQEQQLQRHYQIQQQYLDKIRGKYLKACETSRRVYLRLSRVLEYSLFFKMGSRDPQEFLRGLQETRILKDFGHHFCKDLIFFLYFLGFYFVSNFSSFCVDMFGLQVLQVSWFTCFLSFPTFKAWGGYS